MLPSGRRSPDSDGFIGARALQEQGEEALLHPLLDVLGHAAGLSVDEAIQQARFGDLEGWTLRSSQGATAIRRVYMELNGELPGR